MIFKKLMSISEQYSKLAIVDSDIVASYESLENELPNIFNDFPKQKCENNHPLLAEEALSILEGLPKFDNPYDLYKSWEELSQRVSPDSFEAFKTEYLGKNMYKIMGNPTGYKMERAGFIKL